MTVDEHGVTDHLEQALLELEAIHEREAVALSSMNSAELDTITTQKDGLSARVRELVSTESVGPRHRAVLERLRHRATLNQLLIVHARDTVRNILSLATGTPMEALPGSRKPVVQDGLRINLRG